MRSIILYQARIYCEVSVLDRRCRVLERIIQEEYQLRHRLDTYAMVRTGHIPYVVLSFLSSVFI